MNKYDPKSLYLFAGQSNFVYSNAKVEEKSLKAQTMMRCCTQDQLGWCRVSLERLPRIPRYSFVRVGCAVASEAISASPSSAKERRKERNERREQLKVSWRVEVEEKEMEKKKAVPKGLKYELDMSRLTARGMQWWMVLVPMRLEISMAEFISSALSRDFPDEDFEVFVPSIPTKRKMKDGSISTSTRRLHSGCVFLRCVLSRKIHDAVKKIRRVRGFFGKKVGYHEQVIMPTPVPVEDIEGMRKKIREEEADLQRLKELAKEERKMKRAAVEEAGEKDFSITIGSDVRVISGPHANFEGCITGLPDANREVQASIMAFGEVTEVVLALDEIEILPKSA
eukprot:c37150_g1_i1 orf=44-1060(+)